MPLTRFKSFYPAEDYHQNYYDKNPIRYKVYTFNSGRYDFIEKFWGDTSDIDYQQYNVISNPMESINLDAAQARWKSYSKPSDEVLQQKLTDTQFEVTQEDGTEEPFNNAYWITSAPAFTLIF